MIAPSSFPNTTTETASDRPAKLTVIDIVDSAGYLGDTIGSDIDKEVMQTDARVLAANKMW